MSGRAVITYRSGRKEIPLAVVRCAGDRIEYMLCADCPALPFGAEERDRMVRMLIELPVRIASLRHRTMPELFDELQPGSPEHFELILRDLGLFSARPVGDDCMETEGAERCIN
jgi:hypothetical protein